MQVVNGLQIESRLNSELIESDVSIQIEVVQIMRDSKGLANSHVELYSGKISNLHMTVNPVN